MIDHSNFEFLKIDDKTLKKIFDVFVDGLKEKDILDEFLKMANDAKNLYIPQGYSKPFYKVFKSRKRSPDIIWLEKFLRAEYDKSNDKDWIKVFTGISNLLKKGNVKSTSLNTYFIESLLKNIYKKLLGEKFDKDKFDNEFYKFRYNREGVSSLNNKLSEFFGNYKPLIGSIKLNINKFKSNSSKCDDDTNKMKNESKKRLDLKLAIHDSAKGIKCKNIKEKDEKEKEEGILNVLESNYFSNSIKSLSILDKKEAVKKELTKKEDNLKDNLKPSLIYSEKINNIKDEEIIYSKDLDDCLKCFSDSDDDTESEVNTELFFTICDEKDNKGKNDSIAEGSNDANCKEKLESVKSLKKENGIKDLNKSDTEEIKRLGSLCDNILELDLKKLLNLETLKEYSKNSKEIIAENPVCKKLNFLPIYENLETSVSNIFKKNPDLIKNAINKKLK